VQTEHAPPRPGNSKAWRLIPAASAAGVVVASALTFGAGILLTPIATALTVMALRRSSDRGVLFRLGLVVNALLAILFVATVVMGVYDGTLGPA